MTIELRVLTGARAGHRARFDGPAVTLGRHPASDLRLDAQQDLDVSSRHAELRLRPDGTLALQDLGSTNGTFVNGAPAREAVVRDGDVVQLGKDGPRVEVRIVGGDLTFGGRRSAVGGAAVAPNAERQAPNATARVAAAVRQERSKMQRALLWALPILAAGVVGAYFLGIRQSQAEVAELERLVAGHDAMTRRLQQRLRGVSDSNVLAALERTNDSLRAVVQAGTASDRAEARDAYARLRTGTAALAGMDLPAINARTAPAVAYLVSELGGQALAGTAFAIGDDGAMLTNRHLVRTADGRPATRLAVKFRGDTAWHEGAVVRVAKGEHEDLALIRLTDGARPPASARIAAGRTLREGDPVVTIGYPLGRSTMSNGDGEAFVARTSLYPGTVSRTLDEVLQLAAFAGHGSSGSPVFDRRGDVVGVVWGGPREGQGRIVYAVPGETIREFLQEPPNGN